MVYLRRGHREALGMLPDPPSLPPPPFVEQRGLPFAVGCEVMQVQCVAPESRDGKRGGSPYARLLVTLRVRENPLSVSMAERGEGRRQTRGAASAEEWLVTVHAAAAGVPDFLILRDRYEHALRQYRICRTVGRCAVRMLWLIGEEEEWYDGQLLEVGGSEDDLWNSLRVEWDEGGGAEEEAEAGGERAAKEDGGEGTMAVEETVAATVVGIVGAAVDGVAGELPGGNGGNGGNSMARGEARDEREEKMEAEVEAEGKVEGGAEGEAEGEAAGGTSDAARGGSERGAEGSHVEAGGGKAAASNSRALVPAAANGTSVGASAGDELVSPWEVEVQGAAPFAPARLDEVLAVGVLNALEPLSHTDAAVQLQASQGVGRSARRPLGYEASLLNVDLALVLQRLRRGYYRQWDSLNDDLERVVARHAQTKLETVAQALLPVLRAAASQDATERASWRVIYDAADVSALCGAAGGSEHRLTSAQTGSLTLTLTMAAGSEARGATADVKETMKVEAAAADEAVAEAEEEERAAGARGTRKRGGGGAAKRRAVLSDDDDDGESLGGGAFGGDDGDKRDGSSRGGAGVACAACHGAHRRHTCRSRSTEEGSSSRPGTAGADPNALRVAPPLATSPPARKAFKIRLRLGADGEWARQPSPQSAAAAAKADPAGGAPSGEVSGGPSSSACAGGAVAEMDADDDRDDRDDRDGRASGKLPLRPSAVEAAAADAAPSAEAPPIVGVKSSRARRPPAQFVAEPAPPPVMLHKAHRERKEASGAEPEAADDSSASGAEEDGRPEPKRRRVFASNV